MYLSKVFKVVLLLSLMAIVIPLTIARGQVTVGTAMIEESDTGASDSLAIKLNSLPGAGDGNAYEGWLVSADGANKLSVGVFSLDDNGNVDQTYTHPDGANLATSYSQFLVTIEPSPDTDPEPSGIIVYYDTIPEDGLMFISGLLDSDSGATVSLATQVGLAVAHAKLATEATTMEGVVSHSSHVINIVEGSEGDNFDEAQGNPGDGTGVIAHAASVASTAQAAAAALPSHPNFHTFSGQVVSSANNAASWAGMARDQALTAKGAGDMVTARAYAANVLTLATRALNGMDKDLDGTVGIREGEAGALGAHMAAQDMASYNVMIGAGPPVTGDINFTTLALIALGVGAVLIVGGGTVLRRSRAQA